MEEWLILLDKTHALPLYEQIYMQMKRDITEQRVPVGKRLPSKRKLSEFLAVSQTTIELAYGQLTAEGYITAVPRSGYYVQDIEELAYTEPAAYTETTRPAPLKAEIDFSPGMVDPESFPFSRWRKVAKDVIDEQDAHLLQLGDPHGDLELRTEIATYLYHSRGVRCTPEQLIVGSGTEQLIPLIIRILGEDAVYAVEDPGYPLAHHVFDHNRRSAVAIPVDEEGLDTDALQRSQATVAYVTPSHQFPTGTVLSAARRAALLNWSAARPEHIIIEDDYDGEFRYAGRPIPALQGMDRGDNVIYLSTFSKSLMPSLRIAYMVLPKPLLERYRGAFIHYASTVPRLDQHMLARFMKEGQFSRHLNRMRKLYRKKLQLLMEQLTPYAPAVSCSGDGAGMHIIITVQDGRSETTLAEAALQAGVRVYGLDSYRSEPADGNPSFLLGFGGLTEGQIIEGVRKLMTAWGMKKRNSAE
ncbi:putative HTH-type transcriptional regulator YdeL [Sporosarcina sp. NCCP-2716]|uniref:MocR-like pyridoxine biosynthesis transcription factor PdxR n=1 Tax=Sporosarcina sp. NCCP-2716 TaxID=2943679 RepID=UPI00203EACEA|nr:PLP-dependent aminotransferase family protein [Sporosarcina sp. NCCP-2716]GKV70448.1 putative HTH-type transcriptional regulator YdeL [Sporosarcina sp. NCCP-2716]